MVNFPFLSLKWGGTEEVITIIPRLKSFSLRFAARFRNIETKELKEYMVRGDDLVRQTQPFQRSHDVVTLVRINRRVWERNFRPARQTLLSEGYWPVISVEKVNSWNPSRDIRHFRTHSELKIMDHFHSYRPKLWLWTEPNIFWWFNRKTDFLRRNRK